MAKVVVIVEDTESLASSLALAFENIPDVAAVVTHDPKTALQLLRSPDSNVAAIVTDFNLPHFDGHQLIREVRGLERYGNIPVIMITGEERGERVNSSYAPNAIFRKPFSVREVCRVLDELLR